MAYTYISPAENADNNETNKLPSLGLRGSNRVVTTKSGGPFPGERFGAGVIDYTKGNKQTTIVPVEPYKAAINEEEK